MKTFFIFRFVEITVGNVTDSVIELEIADGFQDRPGQTLDDLETFVTGLEPWRIEWHTDEVDMAVFGVFYLMDEGCVTQEEAFVLLRRIYAEERR